MLKRIAATLVVLCLGMSAQASVILRIVATNPSEFEPQQVNVRSYLPKGITRADILDTGGMDIRYDDQREQYFVTAQVELAPRETAAFNVELEDIWLVPPELLTALAARAEELTEKLSETEYAEQSADISRRITDNIGVILERQESARIPEVSPPEHISAFNLNQALLPVVRSDVETLEKLYNRISSDVLLKDRPKGIPPNIGTIWKVIFVIITFLGVTSAIFFLVWTRQLQKIREAERLETE